MSDFQFEDRNHRRLFLFGLAILASFTALMYMVWRHDLQISDGVLGTIVTGLLTNMAVVSNGLGGRRTPPQNNGNGNGGDNAKP